MRFLSLFSGIGGFDLALESAGGQCMGQIEPDPFCVRVLQRHWPTTPRWPDVRSWREEAIIDVLCGGWPCQDLSLAGKRAGLAGARSGLFHEIVRIATALRPRWGVFENVPGLFSSHGGADFWNVLQGLRQCWPAVGYRVLDGQYFGVPQRRRRVFFVCGPTAAGVGAVLFESESGGGYPAPGSGQRPDFASSLGVGSASTRYNCDRDFVTHALTAEGHDASEDGTGRGTPLIAAPLTASYGKQPDNSHRNGGPPNLIDGVRRLTPVECERLQGFADGFTCVCGADDTIDACRCPDSPRYRALGNAVCVPVARWLAARLSHAG
jgi:DNA (cytosine-5)-methyltransferase 1